MGTALEVESPYILTFDTNDKPLDVRGTVLAEKYDGHLRTRVIVENETAYMGRDRKIYWHKEQAAKTGEAEECDVAIPEFHFGVVADNANEHYPDPRRLGPEFEGVETAFRHIPGSHGDYNGRTRLSGILSLGNGWRTTNLGSATRVNPPAIGSSSSGFTHSVHYNVGIPLSRVRATMEQLARDPRRNVNLDPPAKKEGMLLLQDAASFGDTIATIYAYNSQIGPGDAPSAITRNSSRFATFPDRTVQEVRSVATLIYTYAALAAHSAAFRSSLSKDYAPILGRHDPSTLLAQLPQGARDWMRANSGNISNLFESYYSKRSPQQTAHLRRRNPAYQGIVSPLQTPLNLDERKTVADLIASGANERYDKKASLGDVVVSNVFADLDRTGPIPLAVLEARSFGERNLTSGQLVRNHVIVSRIGDKMQKEAAWLATPSLRLDAEQKRCKEEMLAALAQGNASVASAAENILGPNNHGIPGSGNAHQGNHARIIYKGSTSSANQGYSR